MGWLYRVPKKAKGPPCYYSPQQRARYWRNRHKHERRVQRIFEKRTWLINELGGPFCRIEGCCTKPSADYRDVEIHHTRGRDWCMDGIASTQEQRIDRMIGEFRDDPEQLTVACRSCNARIGDPRQHDLDDVPF